MTAPMTDRTRLTDLARAIPEELRGPWVDEPGTARGQAGNVAAYIAAANPQAILDWDRDTSALLQRVADLEAALGWLVQDVEGWERGKSEHRPGNEYTTQPSYLAARAALVSDTAGETP